MDKEAAKAIADAIERGFNNLASRMAEAYVEATRLQVEGDLERCRMAGQTRLEEARLEAEDRRGPFADIVEVVVGVVQSVLERAVPTEETIPQ